MKLFVDRAIAHLIMQMPTRFMGKLLRLSFVSDRTVDIVDRLLTAREDSRRAKRLPGY